MTEHEFRARMWTSVCLERVTSSADEARAGGGAAGGLGRGGGPRGTGCSSLGQAGALGRGTEGVCGAPGYWFPNSGVQLGTCPGLGLKRGALGPLKGC